MKLIFLLILIILPLSSYGLVNKNTYSGKVDGKYYLFKLSCYEEGVLEKCYLNSAKLDLYSCTLETSEYVKEEVAALSKGKYTFIESSVCTTRTVHVNKKSLQVIGTKINNKELCKEAMGYERVFKAVKYENFKMTNHGCKDLSVIL